MDPRTVLPGKDAPLENTISMATSLLDKIGFSAEPASWLNPAPNCWSVHIRSKECKHLYTNGKGTSQQASLASGLGEFLERLSTNFFFADFFLEEDGAAENPFLFYPDEKWFPAENGNHIPVHSPDGEQLLSADLRRFYDSEQELRFDHLCDHNINDRDRGICCLPFTDINSKNPIHFPVSILNNLYVSNGMAAGNSKTECYSQALSEIIERYVKNHVIASGVSLPDVPAAILNKYPRIHSILSEFKSKRGLVLRLVLLSLIIQFLRVMTHVLVALALGVSIDPVVFGLFFVFVPVLSLAMIPPITINGLGVREGLGT